MNINNITTYYINLEKRTDRNKLVLEELKKININNPIRFNAIEMKNGAIGCSLSHIKVLELALENNLDYVFICEDDIEILDHELFLNNVTKFLNSNIEWDVLIIAGNNMLPYQQIDNYLIKVYNCITTTGYIVKKHYINELLNNYREGLTNLIKTNNKIYALDNYWLKLQRKDNWFFLIPPTIIQRENYSDIEKKITNFKNYMLNYNKVVVKSK